jgi:hypothetical protein
MDFFILIFTTKVSVDNTFPYVSFHSDTLLYNHVHIIIPMYMVVCQYTLVPSYPCTLVPSYPYFTLIPIVPLYASTFVLLSPTHPRTSLTPLTPLALISLRTLLPSYPPTQVYTCTLPPDYPYPTTLVP